MRVDEFEKMRRLERRHWWFKGRRFLLRRLISRLSLRNARILDAGCGTGFAAEELRQGGDVFGLDASEAALDPRRNSNCAANVEHAPFPDNTFDLVVALDLLEHLEDDSTALRELHRVCKVDGYFFATVPAFQCVWSEHDEVLGHYRRYSLPELSGRVRAAGFEICHASYFVSKLFAPAVIYRIIRRKSKRKHSQTDLFSVPEPFNFLLSTVMYIESRLAWNSKLPFGLTAFVLGNKTDGSLKS